MKEMKIKEYSYRGIKAPIYVDDAGQQFYTTIFGQSYSFGAYTPIDICYDEIEYIIDEHLDVVHRFQTKPYYGACIRYDKDEKRTVVLYYRLEKICELPDGLTLEQQIDFCKKKLDEKFASPEYQEAEKKRLEKNDLYFNEIVEKSKEDTAIDET